MTSKTLILASASAARAELLRAAGVAIEIDPAHLDETEVKASLKAEGASSREAAESLAELKALKVSRRRPGTLVLGADQMLECEDQWFDKPKNPQEARHQLSFLRNKRHDLHSCAVLVKDGQRLWHVCGKASLTMRPFSEDFLNWYLLTIGDEVYHSVGGYRLEGPGAQLFSQIEGDYFTILGLPLLPVLDFIRNHGVVKT